MAKEGRAAKRAANANAVVCRTDSVVEAITAQDAEVAPSVPPATSAAAAADVGSSGSSSQGTKMKGKIEAYGPGTAAAAVEDATKQPGAYHGQGANSFSVNDPGNEHMSQDDDDDVYVNGVEDDEDYRKPRASEDIASQLGNRPGAIAMEMEMAPVEGFIQPESCASEINDIECLEAEVIGSVPLYELSLDSRATSRRPWLGVIILMGLPQTISAVIAILLLTGTESDRGTTLKNATTKFGSGRESVNFPKGWIDLTHLASTAAIANVSADLCAEYYPGYGRSTLCSERDGSTLPHGGPANQVATRALLEYGPPDVDFAVSNAGAIDSDIAAGVFTVQDVYLLLPFTSAPIIEVSLTGWDVASLVRRAVEEALYGECSCFYPYGSGIRWNVIATVQNKGELVKNIEVFNRTEGRWNGLESSRLYSLIGYFVDISFGRRAYERFLLQNATVVETTYLATDTFLQYTIQSGTLEPPSNEEYSTKSFMLQI